MKETANTYWGFGLSVIPVGSDKRPRLSDADTKGYKWKKHSDELLKPNGQFDKAYGIAIVCGKVSGGLEIIDIDSKCEIVKGDLIKRYKQQVSTYDQNLLKKLVVEQSPSGGYHFIYRTKIPGANTKLASRHATAEELKADPQQKIYCLLETRGTGGYFAAYPTPGYKLVQGGFDAIPMLTDLERMSLIQAALDLNEVVVQVSLPVAKKAGKKEAGLSPLDDYNQRGDSLAVLQDAGWQVVKENSVNYLLKRPGFNASPYGGSYRKADNLFYVFTSSTEFEPGKAYGPTSVYGIIKHSSGGNVDWSECARNLALQGFGEQNEGAADTVPTPTKKEPVKDFIVSDEDFAKYIKKAHDGTLEQGLSTGVPSLDKHFVFKRANFNVFGGHDNTGKTVILLYLLTQSARLHNWRWLICSTENSPGFIFRAIMEFYWGKTISEMTSQEMAEATKFVKAHFVIVKSDTIYTYSEILDMAEQTHKQQKIDGVFIDPYNSVDYDLKLLKQLGGHEYHYHVTSRFRAFCKKNDCCIYLNCHAVTEALRRVWTKDGCPDKTLVGHPMPPKKADVEGGGKFANRADDFVIIHRYTQHEDYYRITELHIVKVKENESGGRVTNLNAPVKIEMASRNCGFIDIEAKINPVTKEPVGSPITPKKSIFKQEELPIPLEEDDDNSWQDLYKANDELI